MHSQHLDRYSGIKSPIHGLSAAVKLTAAIAMILAMVALPIGQAPYLAVPALILVAAGLLSRIPPRYLLRRLLLLEPLAVGIAVMAVFQPGGVRLMVFLVARGTLCLATMILLSSTTSFSEILRVFKTLRVPALLVTTLALMYRYMFVLADESHRMRRARMARTFTRDRRRQWRILGTVASQLFIRASERAERVYAAMCARGWQ